MNRSRRRNRQSPGDRGAAAAGAARMSAAGAVVVGVLAETPIETAPAARPLRGKAFAPRAAPRASDGAALLDWCRTATAA